MKNGNGKKNGGSGWIKTNCGEGRVLVQAGYLVHFRPDGIISKDAPHLDSALARVVK